MNIKEGDGDHNQKLEERIQTLLQLNEQLSNELETQVTLREKTELAFSTQSELVRTKEGLISNQR